MCPVSITAELLQVHVLLHGTAAVLLQTTYNMMLCQQCTPDQACYYCPGRTWAIAKQGRRGNIAERQQCAG
jgi:hypothetical protein